MGRPKGKSSKDSPKKKKASSEIKVKTEGQRRFLEVEGFEADISAKVGCGPAIIGHWRRGRRVPGEAHRHKLELLFGIPRRAWDVSAGAEIPGSAKRKRLARSGNEEDTLEITKSQIDLVIESLEDKTLTDSAAAKLRDTLAKLLALRARMERDQEMLEDRAVREHPEWITVKAAILRALKPYPEAAEAVVEALK